MPASAASRRASGVTAMPPESRAGPKLRSGVRTSKKGSSLIGCGARRLGRRSYRAAPQARARAADWRAPRGLDSPVAPVASGSQSSGRSADDADNGADRRGFAFVHADFAEHAGFRRRHFHRHLVGLDLEQIVARLNGVAGRFEPLGDFAFGDGLAELRHEDVHASLLSGSFRGRANGSGPTWLAR